jgi:hypothetical protein
LHVIIIFWLKHPIIRGDFMMSFDIRPARDHWNNYPEDPSIMEQDLGWKEAGGYEISHGDKTSRSSAQQPIRFSTLYTHGDGSTMEKVEKVNSLADIASYIEVTHVRKAYCDYLHLLTAMEIDDEMDDKTHQVSSAQLEEYRLGYYAAWLQW